MRLSKILALRSMLVKASASLSDEDALEAIELFPVWAVGVSYAKGIRLRRGEKLYRVEQDHTSQADWLPENVPALYTEVEKPGEIPVWKQPTGVQDSYMTGDKVHYPTKEDPVYENTMDYNIHAPDVYGWVML